MEMIPQPDQVLAAAKMEPNDLRITIRKEDIPAEDVVLTDLSVELLTQVEIQRNVWLPSSVSRDNPEMRFLLNARGTHRLHRGTQQEQWVSNLFVASYWASRGSGHPRQLTRVL